MTIKAQGLGAVVRATTLANLFVWKFAKTEYF